VLMKLDLENLKVLDDGRLEAAFAQELKHVVLDLMDRPGDDRERSVTLKAKLKPICDDRGECESVAVKFEFGNKLPPRKSKVYDMQARKAAGGPMLVFNELSLGDVNQNTLPFEGDHDVS
jgi:hypothetical protein